MLHDVTGGGKDPARARLGVSEPSLVTAALALLAWTANIEAAGVIAVK